MAPWQGVTLVQMCACTQHVWGTTCPAGINSLFAGLSGTKPPPKKPDWREGLQQAGVLRRGKGGRIEWRGRR